MKCIGESRRRESDRVSRGSEDEARRETRKKEGKEAFGLRAARHESDMLLLFLLHCIMQPCTTGTTGAAATARISEEGEASSV